MQKTMLKPVRLGVLRALCLVIAALFIAAECACLRPISVDSCGYVVAVGIDEGREREYEISLELQRESMGDAQPENGGAIILSCEAGDIFDAVNELASRIPYELNFTRVHLFIIGEGLARAGKLGEIFDFSFDVLRIRRSALIVTARSRVRDYIGGLAANNTANIAKMQDALIANVETTGETAAINVSLFLEGVRGGRFDAVTPLGYYDESIITDTKQHETAAKGENPVGDAEAGAGTGGMQGITRGSALFDGVRMCGELSAHETQLMNLVRGDFRRGSLSCELENGEEASLLVLLNKRSIQMELGEGGPKARVELRLNITVEREGPARLGEDWDAGAREGLKSYFEGELKRVFEKCRACSCDAMGFGRYASMKFYSTAEWEKYSWKEEYQGLEAEFAVELNLDDEYMIKSGG